MHLISILLATLSISSTWAQTDKPINDEAKRITTNSGEVTVVDSRVVQRAGVVLDDQGTLHLLSILTNGDTELTRLSRIGAVKQLIMYRGWPYILDKKERLYSLDVTWQKVLRSKMPYIALRTIKTLPIAVAAGAATWGVSFLDQTFTGFISLHAFQPSLAFWSGVILYFGLDWANTVFFKSPRSIGEGGNYFTRVMAEGVTGVDPDANLDDFVVTLRSGRKRTQKRFLSLMAPSLGDSRCLEALLKMGMR